MRLGSFPSTDYRFGIPSSIAKPANNDFPIWDESLLSLNLSNEDLADLQARADALFAALTGSRDSTGLSGEDPKTLYARAQAAYQAGNGRNPGSYATFLSNGLKAVGPYKK